MRSLPLAWFAPILAGLLVYGAACAPTNAPISEEESSPATVKEQPPVEQLTVLPRPQDNSLRLRLEAVIGHVRERPLLTTNGFWTVFHGILGLGPHVYLVNPETGQRIKALDYICAGNELRGLRFLPTHHGLDVQTGPFAVGQGHQDQFVAEMAQWGMPADRVFIVNGKEYTFLDFVHHSQMRARLTANQELSWTVIVVGQYLGTDAKWTNEAGEKLRFEDLMRYELDAPVESAACGGTHRLFGLSWAYHLHRRRGGKATGVWQEVVEKTAKYRDHARQHQNADGSFSTNYFRGPGDAADRQLRISSTGHIFEWLALALSDEELRQPWMQNAANALALLILELQDSPIEGGALYHAVHGLVLYSARMYGADGLGPQKPTFPWQPIPSSP